MTITADDFNIDPEDADCIARIVQRARLAYEASGGDAVAWGLRLDPTSLTMDLTICHRRIGLKLGELLAADPNAFFGDVCGIVRHMDRRTGNLNGFRPRHVSVSIDVAA